MTIDERRQKIVDIINIEGSTKSGVLAKRLGVTTETIRKDLIYLSEHHLIVKRHGTAQPLTEFVVGTAEQRSVENAPSKMSVAAAAAACIPENSMIFLDAGTTVAGLARLLTERSDLVIITNSFPVVSLLHSTPNAIYFIGGLVDAVTQSSNGHWALQELGSLHIDVAFLGTSGFQSYDGPGSKIFSDVEFKRQVICSSNRSIVLADSAKFSTNAIIQYADWSDIDLLITDSGADAAAVQKLRRKVEVITAPAVV